MQHDNKSWRVVLALLVVVLAAWAVLALRPKNGASAPSALNGTPAEAPPPDAVPSASAPAERAPEPRADEPVEEAAQERPEQAPAQDVAAIDEAALARTPALRAAFEREAPDATAHEAEARIRAIYGAERDADTILRAVRCTRSVCKADLRWSPELNEPYNHALNATLKAFSVDIDLYPDVTLGGPEMPIPMVLFIARPGHSVESLVAERMAQLH